MRIYNIFIDSQAIYDMLIVKGCKNWAKEVTIAMKNIQLSNCPYCGGLLEKGKLYSRGSMYFSPENSKIPSFYTERSMRKANAIPFPPFPLGVDRNFPQSYVCRKCHVFLMEYEGEW